MPEPVVTEGRSEGAAEVLAKYGRHLPTCAYSHRPDWPCNCGLDAALASLSSSPTEGGGLTDEEQARVDFATAIVTDCTIPLQPFVVAQLLAIIDRLVAPGSPTVPEEAPDAR